MITSRITPKVVWICLAVNLWAWLSVDLLWRTGAVSSRLWLAEGAIRTVCLSAAYLLALRLNLEIAAEYRQAPWLRVAWLALAGNAGVSVVRMLVESSVANLFWPGYTRSPLAGFLQHLAIVPANGFLLLGLLTMWWAYREVRLGFTIEKRDYVAIAGILLLILALMVFRAGLSEARSPYAVSRWLQLIGLALLLLSGAVSVVLHRMAMQMEGGKLAVALRFLAFYTLLRGLLVLIQAGRRMEILDGQSGNIFYPLLLDLCWQAVPWIVTLAAAYRAELTIHAARELAQQRAARAVPASA